MKHAAVVIALLALPGGSPYCLAQMPNPSWTGLPGELEEQWKSTHPRPETPEVCVQMAPPTGITEISLERTPCFGLCPTYTVKLRSDGSAEYYGQANVERVGSHTGTLDPEFFQRLSLVALDIEFFEMADAYDCLVTDNPTVYVSIVREGVRKTIRHYAPFHTGPPRLRLFEEHVDDHADRIEWQFEPGDGSGRPPNEGFVFPQLPPR